jgi:hypothetical protein
MEHSYWIGRKRSALAMARNAVTAEVRLIHFELAGRHSIKAAQCLPFIHPADRPAAHGERALLHLPDPGSFRASSYPQPRSGVRGDSDDGAGGFR